MSRMKSQNVRFLDLRIMLGMEAQQESSQKGEPRTERKASHSQTTKGKLRKTLAAG